MLVEKQVSATNASQILRQADMAIHTAVNAAWDAPLQL